MPEITVLNGDKEESKKDEESRNSYKKKKIEEMVKEEYLNMKYKKTQTLDDGTEVASRKRRRKMEDILSDTK